MANSVILRTPVNNCEGAIGNSRISNFLPFLKSTNFTVKSIEVHRFYCKSSLKLELLGLGAGRSSITSPSCSRRMFVTDCEGNLRCLGDKNFSAYGSSWNYFLKATSTISQGRTRRRRNIRNCEASSAASFSVPLESVIEGTGKSGPAWTRLIPLRRTFPLIEPFVYPEWRLIIRGWLCTAIAVSALFLFVPQIGDLSNLLAKGDMEQLLPKAAQVLALVAVRSVAQFWQQALLWEASLRITYKLRAYVYERVLQRDMDYFEGEGGAAAGDIAFRLTAEADDTGDTVHSLLHVRY